MRKIAALVLMPLAAAVLSGCPAAVFVGGAGAGVAASDERTTGSLVEDETIEIKALLALSKHIGEQAKISVVSYNRRALLVGQAPSEAIRQKARGIVAGIENVREVHDQIEIAGAASLAARAADTALTAKVKAILCGLQLADFSCLDVKVVTEQGVVYILGLVTRRQATVAVKTIRDIKGVKRVVKVFEYRGE